MKVYHMSGAGNDFMVVDARGLDLDFPSLARELCEKTGADGFMALDDSQTQDFRLHFYNSDGSRGEMCGNGARCICKFAYELGVAGENMTVQTDAGTVYGWRLGEKRYQVQLNNPGALDLHRLPDTAYVELGDPGIPHCVHRLPVFSWEDKEKLLPLALELRHSPAFPKGVNVNFFTELSSGRVRMLTYERGVEDYTLACGTGCASVAVVLHKTGMLPGGVLTAENAGGTLTVTVTQENGEIQKILLEGPAEVLQIYDV